MTVIHAEEINGLGIQAIIEKAKAVIGDGRPIFPSISTVSIRAWHPAPARLKWRSDVTRGTGTDRGFKGINLIGGAWSKSRRNMTRTTIRRMSAHKSSSKSSA